MRADRLVSLVLLLRQHHDEALALLIAGSRRGAQAFGLVGRSLRRC
ncbi:hypothetical protein [Microtetraspora fusca]|nr:hypothetical protein [Microtetraspora fusca]